MAKRCCIQCLLGVTQRVAWLECEHGPYGSTFDSLGIFSFCLPVLEASTIWDVYFRKMSKHLLEGGKRGALSWVPLACRGFSRRSKATDKQIHAICQQHTGSTVSGELLSMGMVSFLVWPRTHLVIAILATVATGDWEKPLWITPWELFLCNTSIDPIYWACRSYLKCYF